VRATTGSDTFTPQDVIDELARRRSPYAPSTIRTNIVFRMCSETPDHHARVHHDLERVGPGRYRVDRRDG
jgi:hypothetical protein